MSNDLEKRRLEQLRQYAQWEKENTPAGKKHILDWAADRITTLQHRCEELQRENTALHTRMDNDAQRLAALEAVADTKAADVLQKAIWLIENRVDYKEHAPVIDGLKAMLSTPQPAPVQEETERTYLIWCRELIAALNRLSFAAQTAGGTAGRDEELCAAIAQAERAMSMAACSRAIDEAEALVQAVPEELIARCREILEWKRTGILRGEQLRAYAKDRYGCEYDALMRAEADTAKEAFKMLNAAPSPTSSGGE